MTREEVYKRIEKDKEIFDNALCFVDVATLVNMCDCYTDRLFLYQENKQLEERIEHLERSNDRKEDNWNKLKEYITEANEDLYWTNNYDDILYVMKELEQGSDSDVKK